jgi:alkylation response protein AidB-like acyl-CoA dehydrogenase
VDVRLLPVRSAVSYTIFEGTSEIQRLVVARSISGLHIP